MLSLRREVGEEKRIEAAIAATVKVVSVIVEVEMEGGEETSMDEKIVKTARITPEASVALESPTEVVRGDAADVLIPSDGKRGQDRDFDVGEEDFETDPGTLGKGGCKNRTDVASAR